MIPRSDPWDVMVDSFFWRDPEELEAREEANQAYDQQWTAPAPTATDDWDAAAAPADAGSWAEQTGADDWSAPAAGAGAAAAGSW